mgnify:CR=1 FL=1
MENFQGVTTVPASTVAYFQQELNRRSSIHVQTVARLKQELERAWNKFHAVRHENNKLRKENERLLNEVANLEVRQKLAQECLDLARNQITRDNNQ